MQISRRVFNAKPIRTRHICLCGLFVLALASLFPRAYAQSPKPGIGADDIRLSIGNRSRAGLAKDAGEFYRVDGREIRLLRSLEKVAVRHAPDQGSAISKRLRARQRPGRLLSVEQELAKEKMLIVRTSGVSSLAELDEAVSQIQQEPDVDQVTPVYINEETGLEMIITDEFIVKLTPKANLEQLEALNAHMGITLVRRLRGTTDQFILSMDAFSPEGLLAMCEVYLNDPIIVWASPNFLSQIVFDSASDGYDYLPNQWHLEKIEAAGAWDITAGNRDIVVAVIDDGVDIDHKDLRDNFPDSGSDRSDNGYSNDYYGWNFYGDNNNPRPSDADDNHGTGVAGVIAANKGSNTEGVLGCAHNCTLMALKVVEGENWAAGAQKAEAILYAAGFHEDGIGRWHGADVINISQTWSPTWEINEALQKAATEGREGKGCLIFCSSGNDQAWYSFLLGTFPSGTYTFRWEYSGDSSGSSDKGTVWLDSVVFPGGDMERFEGGKPSGWETGQTGGGSNWTSVQNGSEGNYAMTGWDGPNAKAMRAGAVGGNQACWLKVTRYIGEGSIEFQYRRAMEPGEEFRFSVEGENIETYTKIFTPMKGTQDRIPFIAYPASHPDTIAVGASTNFDYRADYSRYGFGLDFVAPSGGGSESIHTTDRTDTNTKVGYAEGDYNARFGGTSAASPLAAAVGALVLSANSNLTPEQVRDIMQDTCEQIGNVPYSEAYDNNPNTNRYYGHGRINASLAVNAANGPVGMVFIAINDSGAGMKDSDGNLISHGGFNGQMSKYETTNAQYCEFLNDAFATGDITASGNDAVGANGTNSGTDYAGQTYYDGDGSGSTSSGATDGGAARIHYSAGVFSVDYGFDNHPVTYVSWYGATAFAAYYGYRLPTEWEWQAVADYDGSYTYGCGPTITYAIANYNNSTHPDGTTPVGSFGVYGHKMGDMSGNVWEWTDSIYYSGNSSRVVRGGGWRANLYGCTLSSRLGGIPDGTTDHQGFRVCR